jgi:hypothetical protein
MLRIFRTNVLIPRLPEQIIQKNKAIPVGGQGLGSSESGQIKVTSGKLKIQNTRLKTANRRKQK